MSLSVSCPCGACFEVEESYAGETINCPDCDKPLVVPELEQGPLRTSGFAVASLIVGMVGAFTIVGSLAAIALAGIGLATIARNPERVTGKGYAILGIVVGVLFTGLSLFAYSRGELYGLEKLIPRTFKGRAN
jgi:uncharacterized paraquat-inducible protein A